MTFDDLKDAVPGETVLITTVKGALFYVGVINNNLITCNLDGIDSNSWTEAEVTHWSIKKTKPKVERVKLIECLYDNNLVSFKTEDEINRKGIKKIPHGRTLYLQIKDGELMERE